MNTSTNWESEEEDEPDPCPICESESNPTYKVEIGHYESPDGWKSSVLSCCEIDPSGRASVFLGGDRSERTLMSVIRLLDGLLADREAMCRRL